LLVQPHEWGDVCRCTRVVRFPLLTALWYVCVRVCPRVTLCGGSPHMRSAGSLTVGYVHQTDHLLSTLTVQETLQFSANLRLPRTLSSGTVQGRVASVAHLLDLDHVLRECYGGL
jgi:ABC-type multidrug transport system ATPase subunit